MNILVNVLTAVALVVTTGNVTAGTPTAQAETTSVVAVQKVITVHGEGGLVPEIAHSEGK